MGTSHLGGPGREEPLSARSLPGHGGHLGPRYPTGRHQPREGRAQEGKGSGIAPLPLKCQLPGVQAGAGTQPCAPLPPAAQQCHSGGLRQARQSHQRHWQMMLLLASCFPTREPVTPALAAGTPVSASLLGEAKISSSGGPQALGRELSGGHSSGHPAPSNIHGSDLCYMWAVGQDLTEERALQPEPTPLTWPGPPGAGLQGHP